MNGNPPVYQPQYRWTLDDLAAINVAIRDRGIGGVLECQFPSGKRLRFESIQSMLKLRDEIIRDINAGIAEQAGVPSTHSVAAFNAASPEGYERWRRN